MHTVYELGPFRLDNEARVLTHDGVATPLGARGVAVLAALVSRAGEYVEKSVIVDAAWPGVVVDESNLAVQISAIRRVLARAPQGTHWIETLTRRGYRFVGPVARLEQSGAPLTGSAHPHNAAPHVTSAHPNNIPARVSSFVGRTRETDEVKRLFAQHRLVTLVGIGGVGKTRIALQVAREVVERYSDGVWVVELASISDAQLVPMCVAQVLGIQERLGEPLTRTLCRQLGTRQLLLVLDTCEHVIAAAAALVATLLAEAPNTRVMVTSREALNVDGEQQVRLQPLRLPTSASLEEIASAEAVQLFVERARLQRAGFALTPDVAASVAAICSRLEGIPLAIELAAARMSSLSIEDIGQRLDDRFGLLAAGPRITAPRQRTLRATLDWSYDLLCVEEQRTLRRLAVFAGGFTLEAARCVVGERTMKDAAMLDLLSALVGRSLVLADVADAGTRYRLLDTMRDYCMEKLDLVRERPPLLRRHARYFRGRFKDALREWLQSSDLHWNAVYLSERDNVHAALDWAFSSQGDREIGISLTAYCGPAWLLWSVRSEGLARVELALARCSSLTPQRIRAALWLWLGVLRQFSDTVQSVRALRRAVALHRQAGDRFGTGYSLMRLANVLARTGRIQLAQQALDAARPLLERTPVPAVMAPFFHAAGFVRKLAGDLAGARTDYEKSILLLRSGGSERAAVEHCGSLADTNWALGELDLAVAGFREAIALMRGSNMGTKLILGVNLTNLAGVLVERGDFEEALSVAREGIELRRAGGDTSGALDHLALRTALLGRSADAARLAGYVDAVFATRGIVRQVNEARARARLDRLLRDQLDANEREPLMAEGATLTEEAACRLALAS